MRETTIHCLAGFAEICAGANCLSWIWFIIKILVILPTIWILLARETCPEGTYNCQYFQEAPDRYFCNITTTEALNCFSQGKKFCCGICAGYNCKKRIEVTLEAPPWWVSAGVIILWIIFILAIPVIATSAVLIFRDGTEHLRQVFQNPGSEGYRTISLDEV